MEPRTEQVQLRITNVQLEVLEAVAHLEGSTPSSYAHQVVVEHLAKMATDDHVRTDIENRRAYVAKTATTTSIRRPARDAPSAG